MLWSDQLQARCLQRLKTQHIIRSASCNSLRVLINHAPFSYDHCTRRFTLCACTSQRSRSELSIRYADRVSTRSRRLYSGYKRASDTSAPYSSQKLKASEVMTNNKEKANKPSRFKNPSFREFAEIPTYNGAAFTSSSDNFSSIQVTTSVTDHTRNVRRTVTRSLFVTPSVSTSTQGIDVGTAQVTAISPSGKLQAILRETGDADKKRFVEVWKGDKLVAQLEVTKVHGEFCSDDVFGSLAFSLSETAIVYTAEANEETKDDANEYEKFQFLPSFGEKMGSRKRPTLFIMRWAKAAEAKQEEISPYVTALLPANPEKLGVEVVFGQAVFFNENLLYTTGYETMKDGRRLGIAGCFNRLTGIWIMSIPSEYDTESSKVDCEVSRVTPSEIACRSPRVIDVGGKSSVVWLSNELGGAHVYCSQLIVQNAPGSVDKVIVPVVEEPSTANGFPGLYLDQLPRVCSLSLNSKPYIVTHSTWKSRNTVLLISLENGEVIDITPVKNGEYLSYQMLATNRRNQIVCAASSLVKPNVLMLGTIHDERGSNITWRCIDEPELTSSMRDALDSVSYSVIDIPNREPTQTIVLKSKEAGVVPCLTFPHGGPHVAISTAFNSQVLGFVLEGYTVSQPNYTGSAGYGNKYIKKLLGRCGELDVEDCMSSTRHLIDLGIAEAGPGKQFIAGGSHGGFLTAHAIGQYPDFFTAAVMRNPVIAAGENAVVTDIRDWCFGEFGLEYSAQTLLSPEIFASLQSMSPIAHVASIKAPVLLHVGDADQRVPPPQGKNLYHILKGRGNVVEMLVFPGRGHGLDIHVEPARFSWESTIDWFRRFGKPSA